MNQTNRTIEEKLAIVQQLRSNSNAVPDNKANNKYYKTGNGIQIKQNSPNQPQAEISSRFFTFLIVRLVICVIIFGIIAFIGSKDTTITQYVNAMITTEENGNLIDFMSPFTYTLQENDESAPNVQDDVHTDIDAPSEE